MERILTTCPFSGCGCGLYMEVKDNNISGVFPSKSHPVNYSKLCMRGWKCYEFVNSEKRLRKPLINREDKKEVSWEGAISTTSNKLKEIKEKYGPAAMGVITSSKITNEESYLLQKFARNVLQTNNIDSGSRLYNGPTYAGLNFTLGTLFSPSSICQIDSAEVILVIGADPSSTHPQVASRILKVKERGAKIIVVDPCRTTLTKYTDLHLDILPGTDIFLLFSVISLLIKNSQ